VEVATALLCDSVNVREGTISILSGGITRIWRPVLPAPLGVGLAIVVELEPDEIGVPHEVAVTISNNAGEIARAMGGFQSVAAMNIEEGERFLAPVPMNLQAVATQLYGRHDIDISLDDGAATKRVSFWVLHPDEQRLPAI
jgi:hypothetical protein